MSEVEVPVGRGQPHTWSAEWDDDGVRVSCDDRAVFTTQQRLGYVLRLMVDLFETAPPGPARDYPKSALVHRVALS